MSKKMITVEEFAENLDRFRIPLSSMEREKRKGNIPYYGAAKVIDYVDDFTHSGLAVLIAEDGSVETSDGYPVLQLADGKYWVNNHTHVLKGIDDYETKYLYYALHTIKVAPFVTGAVQKKISQKALNSMSFPYFDDKQVRENIVDILLAFDAKIQLNTQINQTLEQIAQAIFKSWFIDFDPVKAKAEAKAQGSTDEQANIAAMSVISGKSPDQLNAYKQTNPTDYQQLHQLAQAFPSEFEEIDGVEVPKGWGGLKFKEFITESKEKVGNLQGVEEYSVGNTGIYPRSEKYKKSLSKTPEKNKLVKKGYLVFGMGSKELNWGIMEDNLGSVSSAYFVYEINQNVINYIYLKNYIKEKENEFQDLIKPTSRQGQSVDKAQLLNKVMYFPHNKILDCFFIYRNSLYEQISLIKDNTSNLENIRDLLLPKLLNGEVEL